MKDNEASRALEALEETPEKKVSAKNMSHQVWQPTEMAWEGIFWRGTKVKISTLEMIFHSSWNLFLSLCQSFVHSSFFSFCPSFLSFSFFQAEACLHEHPVSPFSSNIKCTFSLLLCAYFLWHQVGELRTFYLWSSFTIFSWPYCLIREWYGKEKLHADHYWSLRVWYGIAHYWAFWLG